MCGSRKYPYSPHRRDWKFRGGGGVSKTQKFKAMYEAKLEFPEGWGGYWENVFVGGGGGGGGYGYFLELHNVLLLLILLCYSNRLEKRHPLVKRLHDTDGMLVPSRYTEIRGQCVTK